MWTESFSIGVMMAAGFCASTAMIVLLPPVDAAMERIRKRRWLKAGQAAVQAHKAPWQSLRLDRGELLIRRMRSCRLDPNTLAGSHPVLFRRLLARCAGCNDRLKCERELVRGAVRRRWPRYCPNAPALNMIEAWGS